ncbi:MAG: hypothetical protein D6741_05900, partial [Planctomycetota bacterium]
MQQVRIRPVGMVSPAKMSGAGHDRRKGRSRSDSGLGVWLVLCRLAVLVIAWSLLGWNSASAQFGPPVPGGGLGGFGGFGPPKVTAKGVIAPPQDGRPALLFVQASIEPGWHIYSTTQQPGGPVPTRITLKESPDYRLAGSFQSHPLPHVGQEPAFPGVTVETHEGSVVWVAALEIAPGVDVSRLVIEGTVRAQPCDADSCMPPQPFP